MSRAFVTEPDGADVQTLPELRVSPHRNFVTADGLRQIEQAVGRLKESLAAARATGERAAVTRVQRDLRYWSKRQRTAELVPPPAASGKVRFGATIILEKQDGSGIEYRIVGEDEADPPTGKLSYVSPVARALIGAAVGDAAQLADGDARMVGIR